MMKIYPFHKVKPMVKISSFTTSLQRGYKVNQNIYINMTHCRGKRQLIA
jgi:hypothetical protein